MSVAQPAGDAGSSEGHATMNDWLREHPPAVGYSQGRGQHQWTLKKNFGGYTTVAVGDLRSTMSAVHNDPEVTDQLHYVAQVSDRVWDPNYVGKLEEVMVQSTKISVLAVLPMTREAAIPTGWKEVHADGHIGNFLRSCRTAQKWYTGLDPQMVERYRIGYPARPSVEAVVNAEEVRPTSSFLERRRDSVFEIQQRYHLEPTDYEVLKAGATPVMAVGMFRDVYFDTPDYVLTDQNCWFRKRNDVFEMKVPAAVTEAGVYEEISDEPTVLRCLRELFDRDMSQKGIPLIDLDWPHIIGDLIPDEYTSGSPPSAISGLEGNHFVCRIPM